MSTEAATRFRYIVFQFGGSQPKMKPLVEHLTREPSLEPYVAYLA